MKSTPYVPAAQVLARSLSTKSRVGDGVLGAGVEGGAEVLGAGVEGAGVLGAGVEGAGVVGVCVEGDGVVGAGVEGDGVVGAGVEGVGGVGIGVLVTRGMGPGAPGCGVDVGTVPLSICESVATGVGEASTAWHSLMSSALAFRMALRAPLLANACMEHANQSTQSPSGDCTTKVILRSKQIRGHTCNRLSFHIKASRANPF